MRRGIWLSLGVILVALVAAGGVIGYRVTRPLPAPSLAASYLTSAKQPGGTGFSWPAARGSAVAVSGIAGTWASKNQHAVPIASVTKIMTAYIILHDHPLAGDDDGPSITVTSADVSEWAADVAAGDSNAQVAAGEVISEREALEALMLPSADNIAMLLARWDTGGSVSAFVTKMSAQARALGMTGTTYTDPSGLKASTVSTARDQLILVRKAMAIPAFADIVAMPSAEIPVAGKIRNFNHQVGTNGIVGVKTGSDTAAQGCWAFAIQRLVAGKQRVIYGVVLGVEASFSQLIPQAVDAAVALADSVPKVIQPLTVLPAGTVVGHIKVPWQKELVPVVTAQALSGLAVSGTHVTVHTSMTAPASSFTTGQQVGTISASGISGASSAALVTSGGSGNPSLSWRLTRS